MFDRRIVLHHFSFAGRERIPHRGLLHVDQHPHRHTLLRSLDQRIGHLLADRVSKPEEHGHVQRRLGAANVREERRQYDVPIDE